MLCGALGVSRSGFYAWLQRPPSDRALLHESLSKQIRQSLLDSDRTYGARRVWHDVLASGMNCGLHLVEELMQRQALRARPRRRSLPKDFGERSSIADNVLNRQFKADAPNQKWVADFTYIWTAEGWLYVAVVLDLFSRRAVGWSMQSSLTSQLVADALMMAVWRRGKPASLMHRLPLDCRRRCADADRERSVYPGKHFSVAGSGQMAGRLIPSSAATPVGQGRADLFTR